MSQFPPAPVYPLALDSDYTLLLVHNTAEAPLTADNEPWADEVPIKPVGAGQAEVWAANGFANVNGELFYYDAVDTDANGKVVTLKRCARNLGGNQTRHNNAGAMVRGFVVAEHHNTLVRAVVGVEKFVGYNFTPERATLDWRIRNLREIPIIFDDYGCPDVNFTFTVLDADPSEGTLTSYSIQATGDFTQFTLAFGDGSSTTSIEPGTHRYAPNAVIDPVVTFATSRCTVVQSAIVRDSSEQPQAQIVEVPFVLPQIPTITIPQINIPQFVPPETDMTTPPTLFPCIDLGPLGVQIPSVIILEPGINFPSVIDVSALNIPNIVVDFPPIEIPSVIIEIPTPLNIPSTIFVLDDIPTDINIHSDIPIDVTFPADITVTDDIPDTLVVSDDIPDTLTVTDDIPDTLTVTDDIPTQITVTDDIPAQITVTDDIPDTLTVTDDIPDLITVDSSIPQYIYTVDDIPAQITVSDDIPAQITVSDDIPAQITVSDDIPASLVILDDIPDAIFVIDQIPTTIAVTDSIPDTLVVSDDIPTQITVTDDIQDYIAVTWTPVPYIPVRWDPVPNITVTVTCPSATPMNVMQTNMMDEMFSGPEDVEVSYDMSGFPSEIRVVAPEIPDVRVTHDLPGEITVVMPQIPPLEVIMPAMPDIKVALPETPLTMKVEGLPDVMKLELAEDSRFVELAVPLSMPTISIDASDIPKTISVIGFPDSIAIAPIEIILKAPDSIALTYSGDPIPVSVSVQLDLNMQKIMSENQEEVQCVAIVPCTPK